MRRLIPARIWTLDEANDALPQVRGLLAEGREATSALREAEAQMEDLRIVHGDGVTSDSHPAHGEWMVHRDRMREARRAVGRVQDRFDARGLALQDIPVGLVDFPTMMGDEVVFLCWKDGEDRIEAWHRLEDGYAGRQDVPDGLAGLGAPGRG